MVIKMLADPFKEFFASLLASKDRIAADVDPGASELFVLLGSPIGGALTFRDADADEAGQTGETGIGRVEGGLADLDRLRYRGGRASGGEQWVELGQ